MKKRYIAGITGVAILTGAAWVFTDTFVPVETETFSACTKDARTGTFTAKLYGGTIDKPSLSEVVKKVWNESAADLETGDFGTEVPETVVSYNLYSEMGGRQVSRRTDFEIIDGPKVTGEPGSCTLK